MMALGGFMVKDRAIPVWIRWIKYGSYMRYGYLGGINVILSATEFECGSPSAYQECETSDYITADTILDEFEINEGYSLSMILLISAMTVWFCVAYFFLRKGTSIKG